MAALFAIMLIIAVDGIGRNFFNAPIKGAYVAIENYLMVAMIFPVVGYTWAERGHISVTLFVSKMPNAVRNLAYLIVLLMGMLFFGLVGYTGLVNTVNALVTHKLTAGLIRWPYWLAYVWMPLGGLMFCLRMVAEFVLGVRSIIKEGISRVVINAGPGQHEGNSD